MGHPELVEAGSFGPDRKVDEGRDGDVVVEAEAYAQALWQCVPPCSLLLGSRPARYRRGSRPGGKSMAEW